MANKRAVFQPIVHSVCPSTASKADPTITPPSDYPIRSFTPFGMDHHPMLDLIAVVTLSSFTVGLVSNSLIRIAALGLLSAVTWDCVLKCPVYISRSAWASSVGGYTLSYLWQYLDVGVLSKWTYEKQGPENELIKAWGPFSPKTKSNNTFMARVKFGFGTVFPWRFVNTPYQARGFPKLNKRLCESRLADQGNVSCTSLWKWEVGKRRGHDPEHCSGLSIHGCSPSLDLGDCFVPATEDPLLKELVELDRIVEVYNLQEAAHFAQCRSTGDQRFGSSVGVGSEAGLWVDRSSNSIMALFFRRELLIRARKNRPTEYQQYFHISKSLPITV
ncbi:hypothetical protein B0T21DRAFT_195448 [Apiosordaria backusii]|uniref:Uncharacterized protein n=1 Tax=Apiosordaria backusii TaxID=314023 RepID=A0AA40BDV4_9PEZI|nr:hypothetical protein B0T21DRAFT_195448 [Apiosordaria backusii]